MTSPLNTAHTTRPPRAITIAGSDSGGGAGLQADLKTFAAFGVYGSSVVTALTAQNTQGVAGIDLPGEGFVFAQFEAIMTDIGADAGKTGMLFDARIIEEVARGLERWPIEKLVVDPVMIATSGDTLLRPDAADALRTRIIPKAFLLTPNLPEAEALSGVKIKGDLTTGNLSMREAAGAMLEMGARAVLIKGGHVADGGSQLDKPEDDLSRGGGSKGDGSTSSEAPGAGESEDDRPEARLSASDDVAGSGLVRLETSDDVLYEPGAEPRVFSAPRIGGRPKHGTGCTLSAAIAAMLARGATLIEAVQSAKAYVTRAIESAPDIGTGAQPLDHSVRADDLE